MSSHYDTLQLLEHNIRKSERKQKRERQNAAELRNARAFLLQRVLGETAHRHVTTEVGGADLPSGTMAEQRSAAGAAEAATSLEGREDKHAGAARRLDIRLAATQIMLDITPDRARGDLGEM